MSTEEFLSSVWNRRSLHQSGGRDPEQVFDLNAWSQRDLGSVDAARLVDGEHIQHRIEHAQITARLEEGATICGDVSHLPKTKAALHALRFGLGLGPADGFAKLYVSQNKTGFPMHLDHHHVFVFQCQGKKRWIHGKQPAMQNSMHSGKLNAQGEAVFVGELTGLPLAWNGGRVKAPTEQSLQESLLLPGDMLYLPPGTWHSACAEGQSIAVSLSPPRMTAYSLLMSALSAASLSDSSLHEDLPATFFDVPKGAPPASLLKQITVAAQTLGTALGSADVGTLARQWLSDLESGRSVSQEAFAEVRKTHRLVHGGSSPIPFIRSSDASQVFFYAGGQEWALPEEAMPFVQGLSSTSSFIARECLRWDPNLDWQTAQPILQALVSAGALKNVGDEV